MIHGQPGQVGKAKPKAFTATGAKDAKNQRQILPLIHGTHGKPGQAPGQVNADPRQAGIGQRGLKTSSAQNGFWTMAIFVIDSLLLLRYSG